ncbi:MAG: tripartite tricarboxylate transporter substrate binding protein [Betaproteobacteria bacterium]|nr:tripartite tricarboxylate transporter substrate binding protein [Betaproteobacteria bacterium]
MKFVNSARAVLAAASFLLPALALAQAYPAKPVRVIVVFPPGGSNDVVARIVFERISRNTGQQFVMDNRGGASGVIGSEVAAKSPADGYTVMVQSTTHVANAHLYKKLPYDVLNDFIPVTPMARQVGMLVVHPALPVKTGQDFIALARKRPGEITYGSAGNGSYVHLSMALMASMANLKMIHVPYKGGGPAGIAMVAGETQAMLATIGSLFTHIKSGRVRPIGVSTDTRVAQFPEVPAIGEFVPGYEFTAWVGTFLPARTPAPIVENLNGLIAKSLADSEVAAKLSAQTLDAMHMSSAQFIARVKSDYDKYEKVVKISGARID